MNQFLFPLFSLALTASALGQNERIEASSISKGHIVHEGVRIDTSNYAKYASDGIEQTRWQSAPQDHQWLILDITKEIEVSELRIIWAPAFAKKYAIQVSTDRIDWKTVHTEDNKTSKDLDVIALNQPVKARYIKIQCLERAVKSGFSIYEVEINGFDLQSTVLPTISKDALYRDKTLPAEERAKNLIHFMSFNEKLSMCGGVQSFYIPSLKRFGLPAVLAHDASGGVRIKESVKAIEKTTAYPALSAMAATWNPSMAHLYGKSVAEECRASGVSILLGPGINIYRNAQNGRNFEYMGEDPYLVSQMAPQYIKGMQGEGIIATLKHYIANNHEFIRHDANVQMSERALREIYLPGFKASIEDGDVKAIMTAYNYFKGTHCGEHNELINRLLRDELGYEGMVMTDWGGYRTPDLILGSGQNLLMPSPKRFTNWLVPMLEAYPDRKPAVEQQLETMIYPTLKVVFEMGIYDRNAEDPSFWSTLPAHKIAARTIGEEAITLLKNDTNILPLKDDLKTILVIGSEELVNGDLANTGGGSGSCLGYDHVNYLPALKKRYGDKIVHRENPTDAEVEAADVVLYFAHKVAAEKLDYLFDDPTVPTARITDVCSKNPNTVVLYNGGNAMAMPWLDKVRGLVMLYFLGQERGNALVNVLSGAVSPSGKLPYTMEKQFEDSPAYGYNYVKELDEYFLDCEFPRDLKKEKDPRITFPYDTVYEEGIYVGYRWYDREKIEVQFPFGFGLSYTTFKYSNLKVTPAKDGPNVTVNFDITNTGKRAGAEVAQLYLRDVECSVDRPEKELKGFDKVFLLPGETQPVSLTLSKADMSFWDEASNDWKAESGTFNVLIGSSSKDIRLNGHFELK